MHISRRAFIKYCTMSAAALGLDVNKLRMLTDAVANPQGPNVIWLKGSSCDGCSISLLNRISDSAPQTVTELLTGTINLVYHTNVMAYAGETANAAIETLFDRGSYILVVEGGIPTAFGGHACISYRFQGREVTFQEAVQQFASRAAYIVCAGTCAAWGGIPASGSNPTQVVGVKALTGRTTVNISGCPANPDWMIWPVVQILLGNTITLDSYGRPTALYRAYDTIHESCPREDNGLDEATAFGQDGRCLKKLGCRGPKTYARCNNCWNGKAGQGRWCIGANAPCQGCVEPTFPGTKSFFQEF